MQLRVIKNFNDLKSSNSGVATSEENQKECIFPGTTLFQHGKDKIISGRCKVLCIIRSKQNSWKTHLFKLTGELFLDNITLRKNWIWDMLEIQWDDIHILLNDKDIHLPTTLEIPLIHKLKVRKLFSKRNLLHVYVMLKQRKSWYNLECEQE